jgi:hypothetical protein
VEEEKKTEKMMTDDEYHNRMNDLTPCMMIVDAQNAK